VQQRRRTLAQHGIQTGDEVLFAVCGDDLHETAVLFRFDRCGGRGAHHEFRGAAFGQDHRKRVGLPRFHLRGDRVAAIAHPGGGALNQLPGLRLDAQLLGAVAQYRRNRRATDTGGLRHIFQRNHLNNAFL